MSETQAPRVWIAGNPEPSDVRLRVRDKHGDIWTPEQVLGGVRVWSTPETALATWEYLAKKWGPLTEVISESPGVSGGDRPEPTPAPREYRAGDSEPPVGTKLSGGGFTWTRHGRSWQTHEGGVLNWAQLTEFCARLSEVVTPEGTS